MMLRVLPGSATGTKQNKLIAVPKVWEAGGPKIKKTIIGKTQLKIDNNVKRDL